jgi:hypothetical protein
MENSRQVKKAFAGTGLLALALLLAAGPARAAKSYPSAGSASAAFLKLPVGARAVAMGGAFSAVPGDPYALYWNPAGLAYLGDARYAGLFHNEYFQGLGQEFLFYNVPAAELKLPLAGRAGGGAYGFGLNYFYTPKDMERRSGLNEADPLNPISPSEGKFGAYDLAFSAGYGWRRGEDLALGAAFKAIRQSVDDEAGNSVALDLGVMRKFTRAGVPYTAGFTVQNVGPGIKFVSRRYGLPLIFRAGLSRPLPGPGGLVALELYKPVDNYPSLAVGVEYPLTGRLSLRSGYRLRQHGNELGAWSGFSAGAGVSFDRVTLDYAFSPFGDLGNSHRFSVNVRFGRETAAPAPAPAAAPAPSALAAGSAAFSFAVTPRALTISPRGVKYEIKASAAGCALSGMAFRTMLRGEAPAEFAVYEGALPPELAVALPAGLRPLRAWQPEGLPGDVQGDISLDFKLPAAEAGPGEAVLLYTSGSEWGQVPAGSADAPEGMKAFRAFAPLSKYYVLAVKE